MNYSELSVSWPLLGLLQIIPLIAGLLLLRLKDALATIVASITVLAELLLAIILYLHYDATQPYGVMQFAEHIPLIGAFHYHAGVDGIGVLFVLLTALLGGLGVVFVIFRQLNNNTVYAVMMGIQATLMSQFVTVDFLWFALLSGVEIGLIALLTKRWATYDDINPTLTRFLQFMLTGLLLLFAGVISLGWLYADMNSAQWSFSLYDLVGMEMDDGFQVLVFFALFYGLAVRIPLFPFHGWLSDFMLHGNVALAPIYLIGIKVGVYALLRFVFPILPEVVWDWHIMVTSFAFVGIFYAALLAIRQQTLRELLAFAVISHTGLLTVGLFSLSETGLKGSVMLAMNFGLAVSGLLLMTGLLWQRTRTTRMNKLGGLLNYIPMVGAAFLIAGLAIVGMPGTPGFDGVHFVLEASIHRYSAVVTIAAALGNIIAAGFLLHAFQRAFLGETAARHHHHWDTHPTYWTEKILAGTVIIVIVVVGFYSGPWLTLIDQSVVGLNDWMVSFKPEGVPY